MSVFIIAEAGVNHNGKLDIALRLIDAAKQAGCDAVKFQTFKAENLVTKQAAMAEYQKNNIGAAFDQYTMLKSLELSEDDFLFIKKYCISKNIKFLSTPFDFESADFLNRLGIDVFKISSGDVNNYPFLKHIAGFGKEIILSTGMCSLDEVGDAVGWIRVEGNEHISLLHCTTDYPTAYTDVNLRAMLKMKETYKLTTGYSDHTQGIEVSIAAVAMGAEIIEKHFTLDKNMEGPDHKASLSPEELTEMVRCIRNVELSIGSGEKCMTEKEALNKKVVRKSIVAKADIYPGDELTSDVLTVKRPGEGIEPKLWDLIIGKRAKVLIKKDSLIKYNDIE